MSAIKATARSSFLYSWGRREATKQVILTIALLSIALVFLFPYYYLVLSSLREPHYPFDTQKLSFSPGRPNFAAYDKILNTPIWGMGQSAAEGSKASSLSALGLGLKNTLIFVIAIVGGSTISSALAAYAFAKTDFPARHFFFYLFFFTMILPGEVTLVPKYVMFHRWHLLGTYWVLIIPGVLGAGGWFLMRMFMSTIPDAYLEAAQLDGANEWHILRHVIFPMSQPVMFTYMLFTFLGVWNDLIGPLLFINDPQKYTVQLVLFLIQQNYSFVGSQSSAGWGWDPTGLRVQVVFAAMVLGSIPTIALFAVFQKRIVQGITITGLKL